MNILFVNANLYGHINPTLGLVRHKGVEPYMPCPC